MHYSLVIFSEKPLSVPRTTSAELVRHCMYRTIGSGTEEEFNTLIDEHQGTIITAGKYCTEPDSDKIAKLYNKAYGLTNKHYSWPIVSQDRVQEDQHPPLELRVAQK